MRCSRWVFLSGVAVTGGAPLASEPVLRTSAGVLSLADVEDSLQEVARSVSHVYNCSVSIGFNSVYGAASAAHGTVDFVTGRQASESDAYAWGSATKMLTGASILRLVSEGHFGLDDPVPPLIDPILLEWGSSDPDFNFTSMAQIWGPKHVQSLTVRSLLKMRQGVPDFDTATPCSTEGCVSTDALRQKLYDDPNVSLSPKEILSLPWVAHKWKKCHWYDFLCYSSTNFVLLGMLLLKYGQSGNVDWANFSQASFLPDSLVDRIKFVTSGLPSSLTPVHGYDRTSYNVPAGQVNSHDNSDVAGVFTGWTASDAVASAADMAKLTFDILGPPSAVAPKPLSDLMVPGPREFYGLATFNMAKWTGQNGTYGRSHGHLGATYGYQSAAAYYPELEFSLAVATNIETIMQVQPAHALCLSYNSIAGKVLGRNISCTFSAEGYWGGDCACEQLEPGSESAPTVGTRV